MNSKTVKIAILDFYNNEENQAISSIKDILNEVYNYFSNVNIEYKIFDVRFKNELPDSNLDIYISSGGPGDPGDGVGTEWESKYFSLMDTLWSNNQNNELKKYGFFICHSFQIMARYFKLGEVIPMHSKSFGIVPVHKTKFGENDIILKDLPEPFYTADSRTWQVVQPNKKFFDDIGAKVLCLEENPLTGGYGPAIMAIRYSNEFVGTQFHPEVDTANMYARLKKTENKNLIVFYKGEKKYFEMLDIIEQPNGIKLTRQTVIPNFLKYAIMELKPEFI